MPPRDERAPHQPTESPPPEAAGGGGATAEAWRQQAWQAVQQGRADVAVACFEQVVQRDPRSVEAWANLGGLACRRRDFARGADCYLHAVELVPQHPGLIRALVKALRQARRMEDAVSWCERLCQLVPHDPDVWNVLGNVLQEADRYDEAIGALQRALAERSQEASYHSNLGIALHRRGDLDAAIAAFRRAIALRPDDAAAHFHLGMCLLLCGEFEAGWREYEWRPSGQFGPRPATDRPWWDGRPLHGRTILLAAEQGLGDTLQFLRFAPRLKQRYDCTVIVQCPGALLPLLASWAGADRIVGRDQPLPDCHFVAALLSMPFLLQHRPGAEMPTEPYLVAELGRVARWRQRLGARSGQSPRCLRIGIAWQGDPNHPADRCRSIPLAEFRPLAEMAGVQLVSLQKGAGAEQLAAFPAAGRIVELGAELDRDGAFCDTAAVMASLDMVLTADTALAHLAGALGVPVWIALSHVPDWRWMLARGDSPWYPSARLFRQPRHGDWKSVFYEVAHAAAAELLRRSVE